MKTELLFSIPFSVKENFLEESYRNEIYEYIKSMKPEQEKMWNSDPTFLTSSMLLLNFKESIEKILLEYEEMYFYNEKNTDKVEGYEIGRGKKTAIYRRLWGWTVWNEDKGYITPHIHRDSIFSVVYYLETPEFDSHLGCLELLNPFQQLPYKNQERFLYKPKTNDLVIFPSHILHWVHPNIEKRRIAIIMDYSITYKYEKK